MTTSPPSIVSRPERQLSSVVLPQPDGPMIGDHLAARDAQVDAAQRLTRTLPVS